MYVTVVFSKLYSFKHEHYIEILIKIRLNKLFYFPISESFQKGVSENSGLQAAFLKPVWLENPFPRSSASTWYCVGCTLENNRLGFFQASPTMQCQESENWGNDCQIMMSSFFCHHHKNKKSLLA